MRLISETSPPVQRDRFVKLNEVERLTSLKKSTIYAMQRKQEFPRCIQVTPRAVAWRESQVLQWVQDRITAAATAQRGAQ